VGSKAFGGLNRRLKEKTAESRWFETTGQAPFGRAKAAYWKINGFMQLGATVFEVGGRASRDGDETAEQRGNGVAGPRIGHADPDTVDMLQSHWSQLKGLPK
jgi:hypothetical protein